MTHLASLGRRVSGFFTGLGGAGALAVLGDPHSGIVGVLTNLLPLGVARRDDLNLDGRRSSVISGCCLGRRRRGLVFLLLRTAHGDHKQIQV